MTLGGMPVGARRAASRSIGQERYRPMVRVSMKSTPCALFLIVNREKLTTSYSRRPAGVVTFTSSPTFLPSRARPMGEVVEIKPLAASASSTVTSLYSIFVSLATSRTTSREPYAARSFGRLLRFSMERFAMRWWSWPRRAAT